MSTKFCTNCGNRFRDGDRFCGRCGQPAPQDASLTEAAAPPDPVTAAYAAPPPPPPVAPPDGKYASPALARVAGRRQAPAVPEPPSVFDQADTLLGAEEPILGVVGSVQRRHGFLGLKVDSYVVVVTPQRLVFTYMAKETMNAAIRQANAEAKAQGKGMFGVIGAQMRWPEVIYRRLHEIPVNAIFQEYPGSFQVNNSDVRCIKFYSTGGDDDSPAQDKVRIETVQGKVDYYLMGISARDAQRVLAQTLSPAIR